MVRHGEPLRWRVLIYRVPTGPASKWVGVWRDLNGEATEPCR
jgi:hypothetical protein